MRHSILERKHKNDIEHHDFFRIQKAALSDKSLEIDRICGELCLAKMLLGSKVQPKLMQANRGLNPNLNPGHVQSCRFAVGNATGCEPVAV